MRRLAALLALLVASSAVAAPAPLKRPAKKEPPKQQAPFDLASLTDGTTFEMVFVPALQAQPLPPLGPQPAPKGR